MSGWTKVIGNIIDALSRIISEERRAKHQKESDWFAQKATT
jgi:hypothetical protein